MSKQCAEALFSHIFADDKNCKGAEADELAQPCFQTDLRIFGTDYVATDTSIVS